MEAKFKVRKLVQWISVRNTNWVSPRQMYTTVTRWDPHHTFHKRPEHTKGFPWFGVWLAAPGSTMISLRSMRSQTLTKSAAQVSQEGCSVRLGCMTAILFFCLQTGMAEALNIFKQLFALLPWFLNTNVWLSIGYLTSTSNEVQEGGRH